MCTRSVLYIIRENLEDVQTFKNCTIYFMKIWKNFIVVNFDYPKNHSQEKLEKITQLRMNRKNQSKIKSVQKLGRVKCRKLRNQNLVA